MKRVALQLRKLFIIIKLYLFWSLRSKIIPYKFKIEFIVLYKTDLDTKIFCL